MVARKRVFKNFPDIFADVRFYFAQRIFYYAVFPGVVIVNADVIIPQIYCADERINQPLLIRLTVKIPLPKTCQEINHTLFFKQFALADCLCIPDGLLQ